MLFSNIIEKKFAQVLGRYEGNPEDYYFSPKDYPEIKTEPYDIMAESRKTIEHSIKGKVVKVYVNKPTLLKGYLYYYGEINKDKLVVFDHGIGAGHLAYFKEIEYLASQGYTVCSYDHTGCVDSEGEGILGFAQGINDLDHVLNKLEADERFKDSKIRLVGHSWGGYNVMNIAMFHPSVSHVISLAGFVSARKLIEQYLPWFVKKYSNEVMDRERKLNPKYADLDARVSLKETDAKFFYVQSKDDHMINYDRGYEILKVALHDRENTLMFSEDNKKHDPQCTVRAVEANMKRIQEQEKLKKNHKLDTKAQQDEYRASFDWDALSELDPKIWDQIMDFLKN